MLHIIHLRDPDLFFSPTIFDRGIKYYQNGQVIDLVKQETNHWQAKVTGSKIYNIEIESDDGVCRCTCNCPYAESNPCKHIAAVVLALQDDNPIIGSADETGHKNNMQVLKPIPKKPQSLTHKVNNRLQDLSREDLTEFIKELADENPEIRDRFLARFTSTEETDSKNHYRRLIKRNLAPARQRGMVYAEEAASILSPIREIIKRADRLSESNPEKALAIAQVVFEELVPALQFIDDSYGDVGDVIRWTLDILIDYSKKDLSSSTQQSFFNWCLSTFEDDRYKGWSLEWDILRAAPNLAEGPENFERLNSLLDSIIQQYEDIEADDYGELWNKEIAVLLKADLLDRFNNQTQLKELLETHRNLPEVKLRLVEQAWENEEYDKIEKLASDALEESKHAYHGEENIWQEWLLKVAGMRNDTEKIRRIQRQLLFLKRDFTQYYKLKELYSAVEWEEAKEEIIAELQNDDRFTYSALLPAIYIEEEKWQFLLEYVERSNDLATLQHYDHHLIDRYPHELYELYADVIRQRMTNTGRNYYQECCQALMRLYGLGARNITRHLIAEFRNQYSNRPAMLDELDKLENMLRG